MNTFRGKFFKKVKLVQLLSTDFVLNLKSGVLFLFFFLPNLYFVYHSHSWPSQDCVPWSGN